MEEVFMQVRIKQELIDVNKITPYLHRERDQKGFKELVANIKKNGLLIPITVHKEKDGSYLLFKGEGRLEAHKRLKQKKIKAFVYEGEHIDKRDITLDWLVENKVREHLSAQDKARLMKLEVEQGARIDEIARKFKMRPGTTKQYIKTIEQSSDKLLGLVDREKISFTHAKEISASIKDKKNQETIGDFVAKQDFGLEDTRSVIAITKKLEGKQKPITLEEIRKAIRNLEAEVKDFRKLTNVKQQRKEILRSTTQTLQEDVKFLMLLKKTSILPCKEEE
jgi:ParB/RepB/Spo0J family partition protein